MKWSVTWSLGLAAAAVLLAPSDGAWADKGDKGNRQMVGTVTVKWKDDGEAGAIMFTSFQNDAETPFEVKLDKTSMALADLEGRRVAITGSFSAKGSSNTVSVKSFLVTMTGRLEEQTADEEEEDEEPPPFAYLEVSGGEEDEEGTFAIVEDTTSRRMLQEYGSHKVEVTGILDDDGNLRVREYRCVLTGKIRMEPRQNEEDDLDDPEGQSLQTVLVCNETGETHPLIQNDVCGQLKKVCSNSTSPVEVVATLARSGSGPITVHRYTTLHSGKVRVNEDEDGNLTAVEIVTSSPGGDQPLRIALGGRGEDLRHYHGKNVTVTGSIREKDGVRWLNVRVIRT